MTTFALEQPIKLIEMGNNLQAQKILGNMLAANPHNLPAWYWYVKTYNSIEERITAVELCLKHNPENAQVKLTLEKLQAIMDEPEIVPPIKRTKWILAIVGIFLAVLVILTVICGFYLILWVVPMISGLDSFLRGLANTSW